MISFALPAKAVSQGIGPADVIHFIGTGWDFAGFAFLRAARRMGVRFTVLPAVHPQAWGDDAIDIRLYRQADSVICLSAHEKHHLSARGVSETNLLRCGLPPMCRTDGDRERFRTRHALGSSPAVLFLGRRDEGKGYPALLRAWRIILETVPDAVLLLAGPSGNEYQSLLDALTAGSVRDLRVPDEPAKADALAGCDVFCLPSAHESFGIVYVEAWSYGKPVICGTAPASRELVRNGENGLWSDGSVQSIAGKIVRLLGDGVLRKRFGHAGRALQQANFTWDKVIEAHLQAFDFLKSKPQMLHA